MDKGNIMLGFIVLGVIALITAGIVGVFIINSGKTQIEGLNLLNVRFGWINAPYTDMDIFSMDCDKEYCYATHKISENKFYLSKTHVKRGEVFWGENSEVREVETNKDNVNEDHIGAISCVNQTGKNSCIIFSENPIEIRKDDGTVANRGPHDLRKGGEGLYNLMQCSDDYSVCYYKDGDSGTNDNMRMFFTEGEDFGLENGKSEGICGTIEEFNCYNDGGHTCMVACEDDKIHEVKITGGSSKTEVLSLTEDNNFKRIQCDENFCYLLDGVYHGKYNPDDMSLYLRKFDKKGETLEDTYLFNIDTFYKPDIQMDCVDDYCFVAASGDENDLKIAKVFKSDVGSRDAIIGAKITDCDKEEFNCDGSDPRELVDIKCINDVTCVIGIQDKLISINMGVINI